MSVDRREAIRQDLLFAQLIERDAALRETLENINTTLAKLADASHIPVTLKADEVAKLFHVEERTIRNWVNARSIPFLRANGSVVFVLSDLMEWGKEQAKNGRRKVKAQGSIEAPEAGQFRERNRNGR